jgi:hypothetical protein
MISGSAQRLLQEERLHKLHLARSILGSTAEVAQQKAWLRQAHKPAHLSCGQCCDGHGSA